MPTMTPSEPAPRPAKELVRFWENLRGSTKQSAPSGSSILHLDVQVDQVPAKLASLESVIRDEQTCLEKW